MEPQHLDNEPQIRGGPTSSFILGAVFVSLFAWFTYYKLINCIISTRNVLWNFNIVATTHALLLTSMSFVCMVHYNPPLLTKLCDTSQRPATIVLSICLGYFIYDTLWCFMYWSEHKNVMNVVHHVITIAIISVVLCIGVVAEAATNIIFATEISTPFLMFRWFMRETKMKNSLLYHVNDFVFFGLYVTFRIFIGTWYVWNVISYPDCPPLVVELSLLAICGVSWAWVPSLCKMFFYKIKKMTSSTDDKSGESQSSTKIPSIV